MVIIVTAVTLALLAIVVSLTYRLLTSSFDYFKKRGIPGPKPYPLFGTWWNTWKEDSRERELRWLRQYGKIYGTFDGYTPDLIVAEPELVRKILVKDFDNFVNRRPFTTNQEVIRKNLIFLNGQEWKDARVAFSPCFTANKMKRIIPSMNNFSDRLMNNVQEHYKKHRKITITTAVGCFLMDAMASVVYGVEVNTTSDPSHPFVQHADKFFASSNPESFTAAFSWMNINIPFMNIGDLFMPKEDGQYFKEVTYNVLRERRKDIMEGRAREDMASILLETAEEMRQSGTEGSRKALQDEETLAAQLLVFMLAGYATTKQLTALAVHACAAYPDYQDRLYQEICANVGDEITYDVLQDLRFMDAFLNEVMRMHPVDARVERQCLNTIEYDGLTIEKGTIIGIPAAAIHFYDEFYPEPEKFCPERFAPENKGQIDPVLFLPFGYGPRNCIGMRFAMVLMKLTLCHLLKSYRFYPCSETKIPAEYQRGLTQILTPLDIIVGVEPRAP